MRGVSAFSVLMFPGSRYLALVCVALLSSCTANGPRFISVEEAPADKAVVYIFRPLQYNNSLRRINIAINKVKYTALDNGGFAIARLEPGYHTFEQSFNTVLSHDPSLYQVPHAFGMELEPGQTYFVEFSSASGLCPCTSSYDLDLSKELMHLRY